MAGTQQLAQGVDQSGVSDRSHTTKSLGNLQLWIRQEPGAISRAELERHVNVLCRCVLNFIGTSEWAASK